VQFWSKVINIDFAFAKGECGVFANSLKRIGKWRRLAFATGLADFNAEAKWQMIFKICWPLKKFP